MIKKTLTIFTPTYNRAYCLHKCYYSLVNQTNKDFIWLIIDDGSTDDTSKLVSSWKKENKLIIEYYYQVNQGMHGAHNTAYDLIQTELNTCIDSDDFMPNNAVENIIEHWNNLENKYDYAGLIGLDIDLKGEIVGTPFPQHLTTTTLEDLYHKHKVRGDKKLVYRTDIVKLFPKYPTYRNEKFVPLGSLYLLIDKKYKLSIINKPLCVVEYLDDGSSKNIRKQYFKNPNGFQHARRINIKYSKFLLVKFKNAIHYNSNTFMTPNDNFFSNNPNYLLTIITFPLGVLLYIYLKFSLKHENSTSN